MNGGLGGGSGIQLTTDLVSSSSSLISSPTQHGFLKDLRKRDERWKTMVFGKFVQGEIN